MKTSSNTDCSIHWVVFWRGVGAIAALLTALGVPQIVKYLDKNKRYLCWLSRGAEGAEEAEEEGLCSQLHFLRQFALFMSDYLTPLSNPNQLLLFPLILLHHRNLKAFSQFMITKVK